MVREFEGLSVKLPVEEIFGALRGTDRITGEESRGSETETDCRITREMEGVRG